MVLTSLREKWQFSPLLLFFLSLCHRNIKETHILEYEFITSTL